MSERVSAARANELVFVSSCFEPSQPLGIMSGLKVSWELDFNILSTAQSYHRTNIRIVRLMKSTDNVYSSSSSK